MTAAMDAVAEDLSCLLDVERGPAAGAAEAQYGDVGRGPVENLRVGDGLRESVGEPRDIASDPARVPPERFDVFISVAGPDRAGARALRDALRKDGLAVFLDEEDIDHFDSISGRIAAALASCRVLLAYYSADFASRPACQWELTAAFLAGQREGDPRRRIIVVNPEDPRADHLQPVELADARYALVTENRAGLRALVRHVRQRLDGLDGTIGTVPLKPSRTWHGQPPDFDGFIGRYAEQWALHTVLAGGGLPLIGEAVVRPVATVVGMSGIGKSTLVAAYGWNFGAAYAGGAMCWLSLAGAGPTDDAVLDRYEDEMRSIASALGLRPGRMSRAELFRLVADHLAGLDGPSLWVVEDVPIDLSDAAARRLLLPVRTGVRTVLTTRRARPADRSGTVTVGPLADADAGRLLRRYRQPEASENAAFGQVVDLLGGHPLALRLAGGQLQDRQGIVSYPQYADRLAAEPDTVAVVADLLADQIETLDRVQRLVLQLVVAGAPVRLPAAYVAAVIERLTPGATDPAGTALTGLRERALVDRSGASWRVHALVRDAARRHLTPAVPPAELTAAAAAVLAPALGDPITDPADRAALAQHAETIAAGLDTPAAVALTLLPRIAAYFEDRGEPVLAAPHRDRLAALRPDSAADRAAAAATRLAAGDWAEAGDMAGQSVDLAGRAGDRATAYQSHRIRAEAGYALARYDEADADWAAMTGLGPAPDPEEDLATRVVRLRSLRLRGRVAEAKELARQVIEAARDRPGAIDVSEAAEIELARVEVLTDGQRAARTRAQAVIDRYARRGLPEHALALAAQEVLAEAWLTLDLLELHPDPKDWSNAENALRRLRDGYRATHGPVNALTLTASVDLAYALVSQGKRAEGQEELTELLPRLEERFGSDHPLSLRARFLRGLIDAQLQRHDRARPVFAEVLRGQRATIGAGHAHTLRTQYELAIALKLTGDTGWKPLMREVRELAPTAVGRRNDLYTQATLALGLLTLPTPIVRAITRWGRPKE